MRHFFIFILTVIPKNILSYLVGILMRAKLPDFFAHWIKNAFVSIFGLNMEEAEKPLSDYLSLEDLFTRHLKSGLRPMRGEVVSPSDGTLSESGPVIGHEYAIQAKGIHYSVNELCVQSRFNPAWYTTVYLAPKDYHRVHSPVSGQLNSLTYIPGKLWPVNRPLVENMPGLFTANERLVFHFESKSGALLDVVMVGALNVGRMVTPFVKNLITNADPFGSQPAIIEHVLEKPIPIQAGEEIGTFMLGSTVVIVCSAEFCLDHKIKKFSGKKSIKMGESILESKS